MTKNTTMEVDSKVLAEGVAMESKMALVMRGCLGHGPWIVSAGVRFARLFFVEDSDETGVRGPPLL